MAGLEAELLPASLQEKTAMLEAIGVGQQLLLDVRSRTDLVHDTPILEDEHGRNAPDAESRSEGFVLINIDLGDLGFGSNVCCDLFHQRCHTFAGASPGRPEIREDGDRALDDFALEVARRDGHWCAFASDT